MYDYLLEAIGAFLKYGASPTALVVALIALLKTKHVKRFVARKVPMLFRDDSDVLNYQSRQIRIESKLDALMSAGGVSWDADLKTGSAGKRLTAGQQKKSLLLPAAFAPVTIARYFTQLKETYLSQQRRMNMKSKLLSRKFLLALATGILVILNDGLDMGLDTETIMYVVGIVGTWILGESAVDLSRKSKTEEIEKSYHGE